MAKMRDRSVKLNLYDEEKRLLWTIVNNAQYRAVDFLMKYESGIFKREELKEWYDETLKEYKALQYIKEKLYMEK